MKTPQPDTCERRAMKAGYITPHAMRAFLLGEQHAYNEIPADGSIFKYEGDRYAYEDGYASGLKLIAEVG